MSFELWTPDKPAPRVAHDAVEDLTLRQLEQEQVRRNQHFTRALEAFHSLKNRDRSFAKFGQMLGDAYLAAHQVNVLKGYRPEEHRRLQIQIMNMAPDEVEGRRVINGMLTAFAINEALREIKTSSDHPALAKMGIYNALEEEDLYDGTDGYLYFPKDEVAISLQYKALPLNENGARKVSAINLFQDYDELDRIVDETFMPENFEGRWVNEKRMEKTRAVLVEQYKAAREYDNVLPAVIFVASPGSQSSEINPLTGEPGIELVEAMQTGLVDLYTKVQQIFPEQPQAKAA